MPGQIQMPAVGRTPTGSYGARLICGQEKREIRREPDNMCNMTRAVRTGTPEQTRKRRLDSMRAYRKVQRWKNENSGQVFSLGNYIICDVK